MEEKKSFEALQYSYENAGQFRAIAAVLGYSEEYRNGDIIFSKGNETYTYPLNTLKLGNLGDNRESLLEQSKERIISFFDKEQASNNFQEYSQYLRENHNVAIIKWDDIKQGANNINLVKDIKTDLQSLTLKIKLHIKEKTFIDMLMNKTKP